MQPMPDENQTQTPAQLGNLNRLPAPEIIIVEQPDVYCDGAGDISPALGHPRIYLTIPAKADFVDCTYCDRRFALQHH